MELSPKFSHITQVEDLVLDLFDANGLPGLMSKTGNRKLKGDTTPMGVFHCGSRWDMPGTAPRQKD